MPFISWNKRSDRRGAVYCMWRDEGRHVPVVPASLKLCIWMMCKLISPFYCSFSLYVCTMISGANLHPVSRYIKAPFAHLNRYSNEVSGTGNSKVQQMYFT